MRFFARSPLAVLALLVASCEPGPSSTPELRVELPARPSAAPARVLSPLDELRASPGFAGLARARAYAINVHVEHPDPDEGLYSRDGALNLDRAPEAGVLLSPAQLERFVAAMKAQPGLVGGAYCYYPHHGVVLEDEAGQVLGAVEICLMCGRYLTDVAGLGPAADYDALSGLLAELGVPLQFPLDGLPPAPRRSEVERQVRVALRSCLRGRFGGPGAPRRVTPRVEPDGVVSELAGVDDETQRCALDWLNRHRRRSFVAAPRLPASRDGGAFEVELAPSAVIRRGWPKQER